MLRHITLPLAMVLSLLGAAAITIAAAWVLAPLLNVGTQPTTPAALTRLALTVAAGVGGVVALVVAYRRQRDLEQGRFLEAFGAAAAQLGDSDVAVRLAGVYAMAGVADQESGLKRQQCVDVLCGYLRLPYSPELGNNHQSALFVRKPILRKNGSEEEIRFQYRQNDKVVRQTIVRVITTHLQPKAPHSWSSNDFDFTGSHLEQADFGGAKFNGKSTSFQWVTFTGSTSFKCTIFSGSTSFESATFGWITSLECAKFNGKSTSFDGAAFNAVSTSFDGAAFNAVSTSFDVVTFGGSLVSFEGATFSGSAVSFENATFSSGSTSFDGAAFSAVNISFHDAAFIRGRTSFLGVDFGVGRTTFEHSDAWNAAPLFDWDKKGSGIPRPANVTF